MIATTNKTRPPYRPLVVDEKKLAKLLMGALRSLGRKPPVKLLKEWQYAHLIRYYLEDCIKDAIQSGQSISLGDAGHIQVLEKMSQKDWRWDAKYKGLDWEILWVPLVPYAKPAVDARFMPRLLARVEKGQQYNTEISNPEQRLKEILNLLGPSKT